MANVAEHNAGGTVPNGSNTSADGKGEATAPRKAIYRRVLERYVLSHPTKDKFSETSGELPTAAATTTNPAIFQRGQAEMAKMQRDLLDAAYDEEIEAQAEKAIKDPSRKLKWKPSIGPNDREWLEQREKFRKLLAAKRVSDILEAEFEDAQTLLLIPPREDGPMLQVQLENAKDYKALFEPGARFHGVADNLATKLTMLKFGLPVEAVTLKNVERCDNALDQDDPVDEPESTPAIQRIMYAEKPLEFLDLYSERSFGYPMLRRPKRDNQQQAQIILPRNYASSGNKPGSALPTEYPPTAIKSAFNHHHHNLRTIFPTPSKLRVRGGAESIAELFSEIPRYIYGNDDDMSLVDYDRPSSFVDALFTLFPTEAYIGEKKTEWFFHIDVYRNQNKLENPKKLQRTVDIDQENIQQRWNGTIRHLLFNDAHDWILRAQIARPFGKLDAPETFEIPVSGTKPGSKPNAHWEEVTARPQNTPGYMASGSNISQGGSSKKAEMKAAAWKDMRVPNETRGIQPVDVGPKKPTETAATVVGAKGIVYGYCGKLEAKSTRESFLRAALLLTGQYPANKTNPTWTLDVDVPTKDPVKKLSIYMAPANWQNMFSNFVEPNLKANQPWNIFVRRGGKVSTELQPSSSMRNVIRISREGHGTAYWKVPSNLETLENCGINQIQPDFVRAMHVICDREPRRQDKLSICGFSLGADGLECVERNFWELVKSDLSKAVPPEYSISFSPVKVSPEGTALTNIRMVGNNRVSTVSFGDYMELAREINNISATLNDRELPLSFRIWESRKMRERNGRSAVIKYGKIEEMGEELKKRYQSWSQSHTVWFRPEWRTFYLQDIDDPTSTCKWESRADPSLQSFKEALGTLWSEPAACDSFCISEVPSINQRDIRFIITKDTTEEDWRLYVFDWLHTKRLAVRRNMGVDYVLDKTSDWGLFPPVQQPNPIIAGTSLKAKLSDTASIPAKPATPVPAKPTESVPVKDKSTPQLFGNDTSMSYTATSTSPQFNKVRIVKRTAAKVKTPKYATWLANEEYQDGLKQQSYTKDQPAVIPGKLPAAPVYGPSRELQIKVSSNFPTVYAQRITPADIDELIEENQTLRNKVLERMWACPICNMVFKNHNNTSIREHVQEHIQQMQEVAECPMCGDAKWGFMSRNQKRDHFQWHMEKENTTAMREQWREIQCPACDKSLFNMQPEAIVDHCLKHRHDIVQYCDRCGLHEAICTKEELAHHKQVCRQAPERSSSDPVPVFCETCGKDTSNQTQIQKHLHERDCQNQPIISSQTYCTKCGLNITDLNNMQLAEHTSRCTVPSGTKRKFCGRCATRFSGLTNYLSRRRHRCQPNKLATPSSGVKQLSVSEKAEKLGMTGRAPGINSTVPNETDRQDGGHNAEPMDLDVKILGKCPVKRCHHIIGTMTREAMFNHFKSHSNIGAKIVGAPQTTFKCPVIDFEGQRCNQLLSLERNNGTDLRFHYCHRGTIEEQAQVKAMGKGEDTPNTAIKPLVKQQDGPDATEVLATKLNEITSKVSTSFAPTDATSDPIEEKPLGTNDELAIEPAAKTPKAPTTKRKQGDVEETTEGVHGTGSTETGKEPAPIPANKKLKKAPRKNSKKVSKKDSKKGSKKLSEKDPKKDPAQNVVQFALRRVTRSTSGTPAPQ